MPHQVEIRGYLPSDWLAVSRIHDSARLQELERGQVDLRAFRPMVDVAEQDEFFASEALVATVDGEVVGFVSWNGDLLTWLYVAPNHQRRGIGRQLLVAALHRIGPQAWTGMLGGNAAALALYQQAGLEIVFSRPGECDGYPCTTVRLALPTSRMRDPAANREKPAADAS